MITPPQFDISQKIKILKSNDDVDEKVDEKVKKLKDIDEFNCMLSNPSYEHTIRHKLLQMNPNLCTPEIIS